MKLSCVNISPFFNALKLLSSFKRLDKHPISFSTTFLDSSSSSKGVWLVVVGASSDKNKTSTSQRTLTIIIKFDNEGKVRDFSYRTSSF